MAVKIEYRIRFIRDWVKNPRDQHDRYGQEDFKEIALRLAEEASEFKPPKGQMLVIWNDPFDEELNIFLAHPRFSQLLHINDKWHTHEDVSFPCSSCGGLHVARIYLNGTTASFRFALLCKGLIVTKALPP